MPAGASAKREREYEELKSKFKKSGRYKGRASEVAARIVNKQRSKFGETKGAKRKDQEGKSPDRDLPISNFQHKTIAEASKSLQRLSPRELREVRKYEERHKNRKGMLSRLDRALERAS